MAKRRSKSEGKPRASEDRSPSESPEPRPPDGNAPKRGRKSGVEKLRSGLAGLGAAVVLMALIAVLAYIAWPTPGPVADRQPSDPAPLAAIEARLSDLEGLLVRNGTEAGDLTARLDDAEATVAALDDRLATIEQQAEARRGIAQRLAALEERVAAAPSPDEESVAAGLAERIEALERTVAESTPDALDSRQEQIAALDARLAGLEERLAAADQASPARLGERIEALEREVESAAADDALRRLGSRTENVEELVDDVAGRLAGLETRIAASAAAGPAMMLAVGQLRAALRSSGPFGQELEGVRAVAADDAEVAEALAALAEGAAVGVPTIDVLRARFAAIAAKVVRADYAPGEGSWVDETISRLAELVTVRRVGDVTGDSTDAIVARAETRLEEADLAAAVAEVENLEPAPANVAAGWLAAARARLAAARALAVLDARAVAAVAAAAKGG